MLLADLENSKFVTNGLPQVDLTNGYKSWGFDEHQFRLAQMVCGSDLRSDFEYNVSFLHERELRLREEAQENFEQNGYFEPFNQYCSSGFHHEEDDDEDCTFFWYETTSGTIYWVSFVGLNADSFGVYLPIDRATPNGNHHKHLVYVNAGMTQSQYDRWYNNYLSEKDKEYQEEYEFRAQCPELAPMRPLADRIEERKVRALDRDLLTDTIYDCDGDDEHA